MESQEVMEPKDPPCEVKEPADPPWQKDKQVKEPKDPPYEKVKEPAKKRMGSFRMDEAFTTRVTDMEATLRELRLESKKL